MELGRATGDAIATFAFTTCPGACAQATAAAAKPNENASAKKVFITFRLLVIVPWNRIIGRSDDRETNRVIHPISR
jgi:hypothetical protein